MTDLTFRPGRPEDASDLAILFDAASRRTCAWFWGMTAAPGQSWLEVGRDRIRNLPEITSHHSKWHVALWQGQTVGAIFGFSLPDPYDRVDLAEEHEVLRPMIELEMAAKGCWLLQAIAVFSEHRGMGYGALLIDQARKAARAAGHDRIVLQVESPNTGAIALYRKCGFTEWERRPFVPFPGSDDSGDWILMVRQA
jgi:ribosomal protein S18 acetylase RimI-like enzyme